MSLGSILACVPKGEHTGKRGPKPKPKDQLRKSEFTVNTTAANKARFLDAGGSPWAEAVLLKALEESPVSPPPEES